MIKYKHLINLVLLLSITFAGSTQTRQASYAFFVAGHTYGQPGVKKGLHPPFKEKFGYIKSRPEIKFGIFTGDIVAANPTAEDWNKVDEQLDSLGLAVYFTVGNHDMENRELYESRYGDTYYSFTYHNDLFIVLDPNLDYWNISGNQLEFLKTTLNENKSVTNHIFVFFHQLLWWDSNSIYAEIAPNSFEGRADTINFWSVIEPLFSRLPNEVFMFSGDVGAGSWAADFMYDRYDNISLIASGMGEGPGDNFVIVNVLSDSSVDYDLICLNDTVLNCFGNLSSYRLTTFSPLNLDEKPEVKIYPNPAINNFKVEILSADDAIINFCLYDISGKLVLCKMLPSNTEAEVIPVKNSGMYFYRMIEKGKKIKSGTIIINNL